MSKSNELKQEVVNKYFKDHLTITELSDQYGLAPSTVFVWCKKYENDKQVFTRPQAPKLVYRKNSYSQEEVDLLYNELMKKDIENERLKKGYTVKGVGTKREYVTLEDLITK